MDSPIYIIEVLRDNMKAEVALFHEFTSVEEKLNNLVKKRDWPGLEAGLNKLDRVAVQIEKTEENRHLVYLDLKNRLRLKQEDSFEKTLNLLPPSQKNELSELHGQIKSLLTKVKGISNGLIHYFQYMQDSVDNLLCEIFPHRKGKIYSSQGHAADVEDDPVIINQKL